MILELSTDQADFRAAVRAFCERHWSTEQVRDHVEGRGYDARGVWRRAAGELGLPGIAVPERFGGADGGLADLGVAIAELGRTVAPAPVLGSGVLVPQALLASGDQAACERWLPLLSSGEAVLGFDVTDPGATAVVADRDGPAWRLSGHSALLVDAVTADALLVVAKAPDGVGLFTVDVDDPRITVEPLESFDLNRQLSSMRLSGAAGVRVGDVDAAVDAVEAAWSAGVVALAHEQVGGAERCLDLTVAHARMRHQFGRAIGSFQAVKHLLADVRLALELAAATTQSAAVDLDAHGPRAARGSARICRVLASDAYLDAAKATIQVHGAIGFTWEHEAHFHFRRATADRLLLGGPAADLDALADDLFAAHDARPTLLEHP